MSGVAFISEALADAVHSRMVEEFGGPPGFNDRGLFLSALERPRNRWYYGQQDACRQPADIFDVAAAYAYGVIKNHPFRDGNKRTGAALCLLFLRINACEMAARTARLATVFVAVARGRMSETALASWLRRRAA